MFTQVANSSVRGCERRWITGGKALVACLVDPMVFDVMDHIRLPLHGQVSRLRYFREQLRISMRWFAGRKSVSLRFKNLFLGFVIGERARTTVNTFAKGPPFGLNKWIVHWIPRN